MAASFPRLMAQAAVLTFLIAPATTFGQIPAASSARDIPSAVQQSEDRVVKIIARAEDHYRKGKLNLEDNKRDQARDEFDKAVDSILESGLDVRASQKLQTYYLELVERIYREEVPTQQIAPASNVTTVVVQHVQTPDAPQQKTQPA